MTRMLKGRYEAKLALVVYEWKDEREYYLEAHEIKDGVMGAGMPLREETLEDLSKFLDKKVRDGAGIGGVVPAELLYCSWNEKQRVLVWYNAPRKRQMYFTKDLCIPDGEAWQPGLVYMYSNGQLCIYATVCNGRPDAETVLYRAPYHNCSGEGLVCLGSARVVKDKKLATFEEWMEYCETLFWNSEFSHLAGVDSPIEGNLNSYWVEAIKICDLLVIPGFSIGILKENGKTFGDLIKKLK